MLPKQKKSVLLEEYFDDIYRDTYEDEEILSDEERIIYLAKQLAFLRLFIKEHNLEGDLMESLNEDHLERLITNTGEN